MNFELIGFLLLFSVMLTSGVATGFVIRVASKVGLIQEPDSRSSHVDITPHGGGLGLVLVGFVAGIILFMSGGFNAELPVSKLITLSIFALLLAVVGLIDDIRGLSIKLRFGVQLLVVAALLVIIGQLPAIGFLKGLLLIAVIFFAGLWWINLFNFMDGIDGIAAVQAVWLLLTTATLGYVSDAAIAQTFLWQLQLLIAAATFGFLLFNWPPARVFMGDVGSTWLAFVMLALALASIQMGWLSYAVWIILPAVFIIDTTITLLTRIIRKERWYAAHCTHAYQHLAKHWQAQQESLGEDVARSRAVAQKRVVLTMLLVNLLWLGPIAFLALSKPVWAWWLVALAYLPISIGVFLLRAGRERHS